MRTRVAFNTGRLNECDIDWSSFCYQVGRFVGVWLLDMGNIQWANEEIKRFTSCFKGSDVF